MCGDSCLGHEKKFVFPGTVDGTRGKKRDSFLRLEGGLIFQVKRDEISGKKGGEKKSQRGGVPKVGTLSETDFYPVEEEGDRVQGGLFEGRTCF